jgi:hypothetical protein
VDEAARQLILWLERRQAERDRGFKAFLDEFRHDSIRRHEEVMAELAVHREAMFRIFDRLDGNEGGTAPA